MARPAWWVLGEADAAVHGTAAPTSAADAFAQLTAAVDAFAGLSYGALGAVGTMRPQAGAAAP
jgi:hypothetical protein